MESFAAAAEFLVCVAEPFACGVEFFVWTALSSSSDGLAPASNPLPEGHLMALYNSGALWSNLVLWGPVSPLPPLVQHSQSAKHPKPMKRIAYYPKTQADQPEWHFNYSDRLEELGVGIGLLLADVTASVNDSRQAGYAIGAWLTKVREFGPGCTGQLDALLNGTGNTVFVLPDFVAPDPPVGMTAVLPGVLTRIFKYVQTIKSASGYTPGIGLLMGIVGPEAPLPPPGGEVSPPRIKVTAVSGDTHQNARIKFYKDGHQFVAFECRRGTGGWEPIGMSDKSPLIDDRALLVAGQAEVREIRGRFFDHGTPSSDWCDVAKVTISP